MMMDDAFEAGRVVWMHAIQNGFFGASDVGCPGGGMGLLRGDHVEGGETLAGAWMLGADREASQVGQGVTPGAQIGSNPCCLRLGGREIRSDGSTTRRLSITKGNYIQ